MQPRLLYSQPRMVVQQTCRSGETAGAVAGLCGKKHRVTPHASGCQCGGVGRCDLCTLTGAGSGAASSSASDVSFPEGLLRVEELASRVEPERGAVSRRGGKILGRLRADVLPEDGPGSSIAARWSCGCEVSSSGSVLCGRVTLRRCSGITDIASVMLGMPGTSSGDKLQGDSPQIHHGPQGSESGLTLNLPRPGPPLRFDCERERAPSSHCIQHPTMLSSWGQRCAMRGTVRVSDTRWGGARLQR